MKKIYVNPMTEVLEYAYEEELLNAVSSDDYGIEYGGASDDLEPAVRTMSNMMFMTE